MLYLFHLHDRVRIEEILIYISSFSYHQMFKDFRNVLSILIRTDGDQCKTVTVKEDEVTVSKNEEKQCNNPLAGLANTVNAITNGVTGDESPTMPITSTPITVNSKQAPPKAMVKPQVLTHVIEGFVIQEGNIFFYNKRINF